MISYSEIPYVAGLIEGEGCIAFWTQKTGRSGFRKNYPAVSLRISMTDKEPLEQICRILGFGNVRGPFPKGRHKPAYKLEFAKFEEVQAIIALIWKWLSPRRKARAAFALKEIAAWQLTRKRKIRCAV